MTLPEAVNQLRNTVQSFKEKRKLSLSVKDIEAIGVLLIEVNRKDRL